MDIEQLTAALADDRHAPDPDSVLGTFRAKRHRRRVRQAWATAACAAAAAVTVFAVTLPGPRPATSSSSSAAAPVPASGHAAGEAPGAAGGASTPDRAAAAAPGAAGASGNSGSGAVCGPVPLGSRLATAAGAGASVVITTISPNGSSLPGYVPVRLGSVRTLHGPRIASGATAWLPAAGASGVDHGSVFAIVWPAGHGGSPRPVLTAAPVRGGEVLFRASACWGGTDMTLPAAERLVSGG